jgi:carboxyl-terminal processing protease
MNRKILISYTVLAIASLLLAFIGGYLTHAAVAGPRTEFKLLSQAYELLSTHGYSLLPDSPAMEYGMIRGMLEAYADPYTFFVEPVQNELDGNALQGSFGGIGVRLVKEGSGGVLLYPFPDGPAAAAGVEDADQLLMADTLPIESSTTMDEIQASLRGPEGEKIAITVLRQPGDQELSFSIRRESVQLPSVAWHISPEEPKVGIIEVNILAASTPEEIITGVEDLKEQGATHYILDLRDNGGGLLDAGVDTARIFLPDGIIIEQQYRGQKIERFEVKSPGPLAAIPLVVLINGNTASAAEIVAGALQKNNRAVLVGTPSYGKDSIQLVFNLEDSSSLHVTAARWWIPQLVFPTENHGLLPDTVVDRGDSEVDLVVQVATDEVLAER